MERYSTSRMCWLWNRDRFTIISSCRLCRWLLPWSRRPVALGPAHVLHVRLMSCCLQHAVSCGPCGPVQAMYLHCPSIYFGYLSYPNFIDVRRCKVLTLVLVFVGVAYATPTTPALTANVVWVMVEQLFREQVSLSAKKKNVCKSHANPPSHPAAIYGCLS